jgi:SAM-dependent methyltransferase
MDAEGKLPRALGALGLARDAAAAVIDVPGTDWADRIRNGARPLVVPAVSPLRLPVDDASLDAVVALWTGFRGVDPDELREVDRALRPGGRLLVVHDYGRDDVSLLRDADAPEFGAWSRREGPFLRHGAFKIRVVHCFWTFPTLDDAREVIGTLGARGVAMAAELRRPRLTWNIAIYHRSRPLEDDDSLERGRLLRSGA